MDKRLSDLDWSLVQSFLAVADTGSLSGAAEALGQSQPTLGRHIRTLEQQMGLELFQRHARGLTLTEQGAAIRPAAEAMRAALNQIALTAEAHAGTATGTVRLACSVYAAHHILPPLVARLRRAHPQISLIVHASDDSDNLLFREADIALRMYRPRQLDLVTRHVGDIQMGIFAAHSYLQRRGRPQSAADFQTHDIVGYDQSRLIIEGMAALGMTATPDDFAVRCDNQSAYWELVRAGCGIGFTQMHTGLADPLVARLDLGVALPALPIWLTAHETVRRAPRVAAIWDGLLRGLTDWLADIDAPARTG